MASFLISNSATLALPIQSTIATAFFNSPKIPTLPAIRFAKRRRGSMVVRRAGPSTASYVFAFVFPMSLLIGTIFTSIKIADKLDRQYLEELAINEAIREADEEEGDDDVEIALEDEVQEPAIQVQGTRTRNRPKREA